MKLKIHFAALAATATLLFLSPTLSFSQDDEYTDEDTTTTVLCEVVEDGEKIVYEASSEEECINDGGTVTDS